MSDTKHTPGPWKLLEGRNEHYLDKVPLVDYEAVLQKCYYVCGPRNDSHFVADVIVTRLSTEEGEANAQLIAAAPELLKKLKIVTEEACSMDERLYIQDYYERPYTHPPYLQKAIDLIAKAEGKE